MVGSTRSNDLFAWRDHMRSAALHDRRAQPLRRSRLHAAGPASASFAFEANGNLTSDGRRAFTYDIENRLVAVGGTGSASLAYDPLGRLVQASGGTADVIRYLYDGDTLVAEYDGSGNLLRRYVHGSGVDEPLLWYEGSGVSWQNRRQLFADAQGSIVAVTDWLGNALFLNRYDEHGIPQSTNAGRFGYTGQIWLPELGMYYYRARFYSPTLGRFLQTDPIGYWGGMNLYAYVGSDPVNLRDPSGLGPDDPPCGEPCAGDDILVTGAPLPRVGGMLGTGSVSGYQPTMFSPYSEVGGGGGSGARQECRRLRDQPGAVHVEGTITQGTLAAGWGNISGTITNLNTGQSAAFTGTVLTSGAGAGMLDFSGSFNNYAGFTGGFDFGTAYVAQLGLSIESSPRDFGGNRVGEIDINSSPLAVPVGAVGIQVNPIRAVNCAA